MWAGLVSLFSGLGDDWGQREVAVTFGPHPMAFFLLAVDWLFLHWTTCYTLCNLKFLIA